MAKLPGLFIKLASPITGGGACGHGTAREFIEAVDRPRFEMPDPLFPHQAKCKMYRVSENLTSSLKKSKL